MQQEQDTAPQSIPWSYQSWHWGCRRGDALLPPSWNGELDSNTSFFYIPRHGRQSIFSICNQRKMFCLGCFNSQLRRPQVRQHFSTISPKYLSSSSFLLPKSSPMPSLMLWQHSPPLFIWLARHTTPGLFYRLPSNSCHKSSHFWSPFSVFRTSPTWTPNASPPPSSLYATLASYLFSPTLLILLSNIPFLHHKSGLYSILLSTLILYVMQPLSNASSKPTAHHTLYNSHPFSLVNLIKSRFIFFFFFKGGSNDV